MATKQQLDEYFVTAVAKTINHVKEFQGRYWYKNLEHPALFGEFLTDLRREMTLLANVSPQLKTFSCNVCRREMWTTVGIPKHSGRYYHSDWNFTTIADDGEWHMNFDRADQLSQQARLQAKYQTPDSQQSVEVTVQLARLEQQLKEINATVGVARNINGEADKVVVKLTEIAESLVA